MWKVLKNMFQPDDGLSEMPKEEDPDALQFTKKEEPKNLTLKITYNSMRYKVKLPDSKKAAHIMRLGKVQYADVLTAKESACCRHDKRSCNSKELLDTTTNTWKMRG